MVASTQSSPQVGGYPQPSPQVGGYPQPQMGGYQQQPKVGGYPQPQMEGYQQNQQMVIQPKMGSGIRATPNFNPEKDCEVLRKAMKGFGTDEDD